MKNILLLFSVIILSLGCVSFAKNDRGPYPAIWWKEVPRDSAASWEILPQDAGPGEVILSKRNELGIFSNFTLAPFELDGKRYQSVEGFWQMMKYPESAEDERAKFPGLIWKHTREQVSQMTAFEAKAAGDLASANMKAMGINWVTYLGEKMTYKTPEKGAHYSVILRAMKAKLEQNPEVRRLLKATGDLVLKPDHHQGEEPPPAWRYFDIWMEFRKH